VLAEELEEFGYEVAKAGSGAAAVALLDSGERFDLLVTDLSMHGMDGIAVIREAQRRTPRLPAILLTGYAEGAAALGMRNDVAGAFTLVTKPVRAQHLVERMAMLMDSSDR
jgi:CheY-like chemotaxis protein